LRVDGSAPEALKRIGRNSLQKRAGVWSLRVLFSFEGRNLHGKKVATGRRKGRGYLKAASESEGIAFESGRGLELRKR